MQYDDEEYNALLNDDTDWTKAETDQLMELCKRFAMRFVVIADRWGGFGGKDRSVEELRARYSNVARRLLISREGGVEQAANHYLVRHPYDGHQEKIRKEALRNLYSKTAKGQQDDQQILAKAKQIEEARRAELVKSMRADPVRQGRRPRLLTAPRPLWHDLPVLAPR